MDNFSKEIKTVSQPKGLLIRRILNVIFTLAEVILAFRLAFKAFGANRDNGFVRLIYSITGFYVSIFEGIFSNIPVNKSGAVFEISTLITMVVVGIVAAIILTLVRIDKVVHLEKTEIKDQPNK